MSSHGGAHGTAQNAMARGQDVKNDTEKARKGVNHYLDDEIQPSAARDAELGMTSQHKQPIDPTSEGSKGHSYADGPAMGTGMSHKGPFHSQDPRSGEGFSADAKALGHDVKAAMTGGNVKHGTTATDSSVMHPEDTTYPGSGTTGSGTTGGQY
ncbi:MAG: hypothetical protein M1828_001258 [Chrysothrix sp. TS-e1954]|nr:MAG: hypothetical protein M1828_001258 [Chrysothrix sp. TS-e1954]